MVLFWQLIRLSFQRQLTYRAANLAGLATNMFFGLLRATVLIALYGAHNEVNGLSLRGAVTYTGLTQGIIAFLSLFGWYELMNSVARGDIAADLLKPFSLFSFWLAQDIGRAFANLLLRGLTMMVAYALVYPIILPSGPTQWLAFAISLSLALLISFSYRFLFNLAAFWVPNATGVGRFAFALLWGLSGFLFPLRFFPDWFIRLVDFTPFPSMINTVVEVYLGVVKGPALLAALGTQLAWFIGLALLCQLVLRAGIRALVIQGG